MRFIAALTLLVLISDMRPVPAEAGSLSFGGFFCPMRMPCNQADPSFPSMSQIVSMGNACLTRNMGSIATSSYFDSMTQIDDSGCLSSDADTASSANNGHVVAHCCIVQVPSSAQCALYCSTSG